MNALVAKEIRLLLPAYLTALCLPVIPLWIQQALTAGGPDVVVLHLYLVVWALWLGSMLLALSSFGREFGAGGFSLLLMQPVPRARIWRVKALVLAGALLCLLASALLYLKVWISFRELAPWLREMRTHWLREFGEPTVLAMAVIVVSAWWATLLVRQVVAAFWLALILPAGILSLGGIMEVSNSVLHIALSAYAVASFWWARHLFLHAQEAGPTGGDAILGGQVSTRGRERSATRCFRPLAGLIGKEIRMYKVALVGIICLFLLHLGTLAGRKMAIASRISFSMEMMALFGLVWLVVPVLTGGLSVAEERSLGMMEGQLCLPVSRRTQFLLKLGLQLLMGGVLCPLLLLVAERIGVQMGLREEVLTPEFGSWTPAGLAVLFAVFFALSLMSFYASTLTRGTLQSTGSTLLLCIFLILVWELTIEKAHARSVPLLRLVAWPLAILELLWISYLNFRSLADSRRLWLRNLGGLVAVIVGSEILAAGIYHRVWEYLTPAESKHGPARLASHPRLGIPYGGFNMLFPDGRIFVDRVGHDPGRFLPLGSWGEDQYGISLGARWISLPGNGFLPGSNWVDVAASLEVAAISSDGTLWVSEHPSPPFVWRGSQSIPQPPARLVPFGNERNWRRVACGPLWRDMILLKADGSLWRLGDSRTPWPGLRNFEPRQLGSDFDWVDVTMTSLGTIAWKTNGLAWRIVDSIYSVQTEPARVIFEPDFAAQRMEALDGARWASIASFATWQLGVRRDGTLWTWQERWREKEGFHATAKPFQIGTGTNWVSVAAGQLMAAALQADGSLWKWDNKSSHYDPDRESPFVRPPTRLGTHQDWVALGVWDGVVALAADGTLWQWPASYVSDRTAPLVAPGKPAMPLLGPSRKPERIENIFDAR